MGPLFLSKGQAGLSRVWHFDASAAWVVQRAVVLRVPDPACHEVGCAALAAGAAGKEARLARCTFNFEIKARQSTRLALAWRD